MSMHTGLHCGNSLISGIWIHTATFYKQSGQNRTTEIFGWRSVTAVASTDITVFVGQGHWLRLY